MKGCLLMGAACDATRLALARAVSDELDWTRVLEVARAERLLGIAWLRSGSVIRAGAPPSVAATWRAAALDQDDRARLQLETLVELKELLSGRGVRPIVLKGPPLSVRLYNELGARLSVDVDLLVPEESRSVANEALQRAGWTKWLGQSPWDECFYRRHSDGVEYLEVHSRLPGEALSHCGPLHMDTETFRCERGQLDVACGRTLAVYLAANMAKHGVLPLSALVDFRTLWESVPESEQDAIRDLARRFRLAGCLDWVVRQTNLLMNAADECPEAVEELGFGPGGRAFGHTYLRLIRLADRPSDAARLAAAWVWPRPSRDSWRNLRTVWARRLRKARGNVGSFQQRYAGF